MILRETEVNYFISSRLVLEVKLRDDPSIHNNIYMILVFFLHK